MKLTLRLKTLAAVLLALAGATVWADVVQAPEVFTAVAEPAGLALPREALRYTTVEVDRDLLTTRRVGDLITFNLFADAALVAEIRSITPRPNGMLSIGGALVDVPGGYFTMVVNQDVVLTFIDALALENQRYATHYLGDGVHLVFQVDDPKLPDCALEQLPAAAQRAPAPDRWSEPRQPWQNGGDGGDGGLRGCSQPDPQFDVIVIYTTKAKNAAGGQAAIEAQAQLATDTGNVGYANSQMYMTLRLVHTSETSYGESGTFDQHRDRERDPSDGYMDEIPGKRDQYGADMVSLFVVDDDGGTTCGIAYCTPGDSSYGYQVTNWDCAVSNFSFHHEFGHLQGSAHNREDAGSGCNEYSYSYGWRWFNNRGSGRRSVMAYDNSYKDFVRINYFSNPDVYYENKRTGVPIGDDNESDNAVSITNTARDRESWRLSKFSIWVDFYNNSGLYFGTFSFPYRRVSDAVNAAYGGSGALLKPTIWIKAGQSNETIRISKPLILNTCGGTARIGG